MGTHVVSGVGRAVVVRTGDATEFGRVARRTGLRRSETEFERGVRRLGQLLVEVTLVLVLVIFAANVLLARPPLDSLLFSLALAVGLTPQLLPAIVSINLAHGARRMARARVIVKRLASIEDFGSMDVLCSDKTGTLTEGVVRVREAVDLDGGPSERVFLHAYLNAAVRVRLPQSDRRGDPRAPLARHLGLSQARRDPLRLHAQAAERRGRGAVGSIPGDQGRPRRTSSRSARAPRRRRGRSSELDEVRGRDRSASRGVRRSRDSARSAWRIASSGPGEASSNDRESGLIFLGFLVLHDPPKADAARTVAELASLGITLKVLTGDNRLVAATVARAVGLPRPEVLTGAEIDRHDRGGPGPPGRRRRRVRRGRARTRRSACCWP